MEQYQSKVWLMDRLEELKVKLESLSPDSNEYEQVEAEIEELSTHLATLRLIPITIPD